MSTGGPIIQLKEVSFAYAGVPVLEAVNLEIDPLESVSIIGPNGGGKTTLLKLLLGLLRPSRGEVLLFGQPPEHSRQRIGYMPQHVKYDPQFPITVQEVVLMGRLGQRWGSRYTRADRAAALAALAEAGLEGLAGRHFAALSGGQRQRVLIARALACRPELLLLDEPTASVDNQVEEQLGGILLELARRMTIVTVSHDMGFVLRLVKKVVCVNRRVAVHPTSDLTGEAIQQIYGSDRCLVRHDHAHSGEGTRDA
jgi:zinc transport system ATP-binding protein